MGRSPTSKKVTAFPDDATTGANILSYLTFVIKKRY